MAEFRVLCSPHRIYKIKTIAKSTITQEQFLEAYNKHLPNSWTKFVYRYFSTKTHFRDKWVSMLFIFVESILFALGFIGTVIGASHTFVGAVTISFSVLLFALGILLFPAFIMNNARIKKICKSLNISVFTYNHLADKYMPE